MFQQLLPKIKGNPLSDYKDFQGTKTKKTTVNNIPKKAVKSPEIDNNKLKCSDEITIDRFDLKKLGEKSDGKRVGKDIFIFLIFKGIIGMSGSGKSRLMLEIMRENRDLSTWCIVNPSEKTNKMYQRYVPPGVVHDSPDVDKILEVAYKFKKRQIKTCDAWTIPDSQPPSYYHDPRGAFILDDCQEDKKLYNDKIFGWLYCNSRNAHAHFFILVQYLYQLNKEHRKNLSHLFIFRVSSEDDYKTLYKEFGGAFSDCGGFNLFKKVFAKATEDRRCLVLDLLSTSARFQDRVFWYKAEFHQPSFTVGADWFITKCNEQYDKNWKEKHPDLDDADLEYIPKGKKGKQEIAKKTDIKVILKDRD